MFLGKEIILQNKFPVKLLIPFMDNMLFIKDEEFKEIGLLLSIPVSIFYTDCS